MEETLYKEFILDLYRNPLNKKKPERFDIQMRGHNPSCGDDYEIFIALNGEKIFDIGFLGDGCAISTAAMSLVTDAVKGKERKDVCAITQQTMIELLGIPVSYTREKCALLGLSTIQKALL